MPLRAGSASRSAASWQASSSAIIARIAGTAAAAATAAPWARSADASARAAPSRARSASRVKRSIRSLAAAIRAPSRAASSASCRRAASSEAWRSSAACAASRRSVERRLVAGGERLQLRQPGRPRSPDPARPGRGRHRCAPARRPGGRAGRRPCAGTGPTSASARAGLVQPRPRRQLGLHRRVQRRRGAGRPLGGIGRRPLQRAVLAGQPVALGAGREPCGLAGVGDPPQLSAISIDPRPVGRHGNALLDRGQIVHQPHALDRPGQRRVAQRRHLGQRSTARRRTAVAACGASGDHRQLAAGLAHHVQSVLQPLRHDRAGAPPERRGHRALVPRRRLDPGDQQPGSAVAQRARRRRQAVPSLDRCVQRLQPRRQRRQPLGRPGRRLTRPAVGLARRRRPLLVLRRLGGRRRQLVGGLGDPGLERRHLGLRRVQLAARSVGRAAQLAQPRPQVGQPGDARLDVPPKVRRLALGLRVRPARVERRRQRGFGSCRRVAQAALVGRLERRHLGHVLLRRHVGRLGLGGQPLRLAAVGLGVDAAPRLGALQLGDGAVGAGALRGQPLARRLECVERTCRPLLRAGQAGQLALGRGPPLADLRDLGVDRVA